MSREPFGAVAVDLGASSGRIAAATVRGDEVEMRVVRKLDHEARVVDGRWTWDFEKLVSLCREALEIGESRYERFSLGIDSWGVDHGFLGEDGRLAAPIVAYRDPSHVEVFAEFADLRPELFRLSGIQHAPFNTFYQLVARRREHPDWPDSKRWLILPDLLAYFLGGAAGTEITQASTTQLVDLSGAWSQRLFELAGWPVPKNDVELPGSVVGRVGNCEIVRVAGHDTASAVLGLGSPAGSTLFLNVGTWSLLGCLLDEPLASPEAEVGGWTNERAHDGRVRFLKNIPGFYAINRIHQELGIHQPVGEWLSAADSTFLGRYDAFDEGLYNPDRMVEACLERIDRVPGSASQWAAAALGSLVDAIVAQPRVLGSLLGRKFTEIRVGGGGSRSSAFCQALADGSGLSVIAGPAEATLFGNVLLQLSACGQVPRDALASLRLADAGLETYAPRAR